MHLKGGTNFQWVVSHGGQPCMGRHSYMEPSVELSALLKRNKQAVSYAKHMVNNPRGMFLPTLMSLKCGTHFQFVESHGGLSCLARHLCMEPPCMAVPPPPLKLNKYISTNATNKVSNPWGTQSVHRDPFGRCNRVPMCSFLWGTAMHGRTPVHGTPMCRCPPFRNTKNRWKVMLNTW